MSRVLCESPTVSRFCRLPCVLIALAASAWGSAASAQLTHAMGDGRRPPSVLRRFQVEHLSRLLAGTVDQRRRGIARLSGIGTDAALAQLTSFALERREELGGKDWVSLVRALAPHATRGNVGVVLSTLMSQRADAEAAAGELELFELARGSAALALAASGTDAALSTLARALRAGGPGAALAADALLAHPPRDLAPVLGGQEEPSVELARWLGQLGDQRAFHVLRGWVRGGTAEVRAAAAVALTELGHMETVPLARAWIDHPLAVLRDAALRILMLAQDAEATRQLVKAIRGGMPTADQRAYMLAYPSPELGRAVLSSIPELEREGGAAAWWAIVGHGGGASAVQGLAAALQDPRHAFAAAQALARMSEGAAGAALERAVAAGVALPLTVRALAARSWARGERLSERLSSRLVTLSHSAGMTERMAAAWALSLAGADADAALTELQAPDEARVLGAASTVLALGDDVLELAAARLEGAAPGRVRTALAAALSSPAVRRTVTSTVLRALLAEEGPALPLALRALSSRPASEVGALVERYMEHPDPLLRAHLARGLGESQELSAVGLLVRMFEFETEGRVRQALVRALSAHEARAARRALAVAARLDPIASVRSAARLALHGVRLGDPPARPPFLWAELRTHVPAPSENLQSPTPTTAAAPATAVPSARRGARAGTEPTAALIEVAPGLAVPAFGDIEGLLVIAGVGREPLGIRLL